MRTTIGSVRCQTSPRKLAALLTVLVACGGKASGESRFADRASTPVASTSLVVPSAIQCAAKAAAPTAGGISVSQVATGLENPWSLVFLSDGQMLVTERPGRMRIIAHNGSLSNPIRGVPKVFAYGQGGLLDVILDPNYASSHLIYFSYAESGSSGIGTAVARAVLDPDAVALSEVTVIYRQVPKVAGSGHFGSRLLFGSDGKLFISLGERQKFAPAQDTLQSLGKIIRINADSTIPIDNPFVGNSAYLPEIWSYGHRNPQGMTRHPVTGQIWTAEHGAMGGDEINTPEAGKNYGWPVISYGLNYDGTKIGEGTAKAGVEQPRCYWDPSIAPGNLVFYIGGKVPAWSGNLFVAALKDSP